VKNHKKWSFLQIFFVRKWKNPFSDFYMKFLGVYCWQGWWVCGPWNCETMIQYLAGTALPSGQCFWCLVWYINFVVFPIRSIQLVWQLVTQYWGLASHCLLNLVLDVWATSLTVWNLFLIFLWKTLMLSLQVLQLPENTFTRLDWRFIAVSYIWLHTVAHYCSALCAFLLALR